MAFFFFEEDFFLVDFFFVDFWVDFLADFFLDFVELLSELFLAAFFALFLSAFFEELLLEELLLEELLLEEVEDVLEPEDDALFFFESELEDLELLVPELLDFEVLAVLAFVPFFKPLPEVILLAVLSPTPFTRAIKSSRESNRPPLLRSLMMRLAITGPTPSTVCSSSRLALFTSSANA